jgi:hypothetical protein
MLFLISCEWTIVSYYQNTNIILASEKQRYTFTFAALIMNIFNALFLVWVFLDKNNPRLVNYLILLFIINIIIGLISCSLYDHLYYYGRFNDVIIAVNNLDAKSVSLEVYTNTNTNIIIIIIINLFFSDF